MKTWLVVTLFALIAVVVFVPFARNAMTYSDKRKRAKALALKYSANPEEALKVFSLFQTENASFDPESTAYDGKSYGLGQITPFWIEALLKFTPPNPVAYLKDGDNNARLTVAIIRYFESKGFKFPESADVYNVGETLWAKRVRNAIYRQRYLDNYTRNKKEFGL